MGASGVLYCLRMKPNYFLIIGVALLTSVVGSLFTEAGLGWYRTLRVPAYTPSSVVISVVWTIIFILATLSALLVWNRTRADGWRSWTIFAFIINAALNASWSYLFFVQHAVLPAAIEAVVLEFSIIALIALIWPRHRSAALLLVPYALWVAFATFLTFMIWRGA